VRNAMRADIGPAGTIEDSVGRTTLTFDPPADPEQRGQSLRHVSIMPPRPAARSARSRVCESRFGGMGARSFRVASDFLQDVGVPFDEEIKTPVTGDAGLFASSYFLARKEGWRGFWSKSSDCLSKACWISWGALV